MSDLIIRSFHFPAFTLLMLVLIASFAELTKSNKGRLKPEWLLHMGYAPKDIWFRKIEKIFLSALITDSQKAYIQALILIFFFVGTLEIMTRTWYTLICFWSVHVLTLLIVSLLIIIPAKKSGHVLGEELYFAKDVGPSAGYFGCLGVLLGYLPGALSLISLILMCVGILVYLTQPVAKEHRLMKIHSDLAHLIAVLIGFALGLFDMSTIIAL